MSCPICAVSEADRVLATDQVIGIFDRYPVGPAHPPLISLEYTTAPKGARRRLLMTPLR